MRSLAELVQDLPAELYNDILERVIAVEAEVDIDDGMCLVTTHLKTSSNSIARLQAACRTPDQSRYPEYHLQSTLQERHFLR